MKMSEKVAYTALFALAVLVAYRYRKRLWEWFCAEPETEYIPEDANAAIYMYGSDDYDYELDLD